MKKILIAAALVAGLAVPATAATIDFTASNAKSGGVLDTTWNVYDPAGMTTGLSNSTHDNKVGCTGQGWDFVCAGTKPYDVGFGVKGSNNNEIDGSVPRNVSDEFVEVRFGKRVQVTGFAGMLTYANSRIGADREQVALEFWNGMAWVLGAVAEPLAIINQIPGDLDTAFDTVGLAFRDDLSIFTDKVRFRATGVGRSDDGSFNVTAAGLQVAPVPVPAGLPLMLTGLGALAWAARRKQRKAA